MYKEKNETKKKQKKNDENVEMKGNCSGTFFQAELVIAGSLKVIKGDKELRVFVVGFGME